MNMVLEDVTEYEVTPEGKKVRAGLCGMGDNRYVQWQMNPSSLNCNSHPKQETKLSQILLNGNNIALLVPGGKPEE